MVGRSLDNLEEDNLLGNAVRSKVVLVVEVVELGLVWRNSSHDCQLLNIVCEPEIRQ